MANWRIRNPGDFPPDFHRALTAGPGEHILTSRYTEAAAIADQRLWRIFTFSIRNHPSHALYAFATGFSHRTKVRWDRGSKTFRVILATRRKVWEDMEFLP